MATRSLALPRAARGKPGNRRVDCTATYGKRIGVALLSTACIGMLWQAGHPKPSLLSFRVGEPFEEVVQDSTFPVLEHSALPAGSSTQFGATYITGPAVAIRFDDPEHGFTLPPTNFATLTYRHNIAAMLTASAMPKPLAFNEAMAVLEDLQNQFKAGGWQPWEPNGSTWFDLTREGKTRLYTRMFEPGHMHTATLRIPKKYGMTFRLACAEGCRTRTPPYRFMVDVGVGDDIEGWQPGDPAVWDRTHPAAELPRDWNSRSRLSGPLL